MNTPIYDFVSQYNKDDISRLHMPGHKGKKMLGIEEFDITEINGADSLFHADGIIRESENNATSLFRSGKTLFSTEGSTHCIKSMVAIAVRVKNNNNIIALRNVHKAFINACALLDLNVIWIYPDEENDSICSCKVDTARIEQVVKNTNAAALYVTSPDYLGNMQDIEELARICHENDKLLLVDNAHGAYLAFCEDSLHPISRGADICCDSAHKTLPVLTGGAYLHLQKDVVEALDGIEKDVMALFGSTSPSYLTMLSMDLCNKYMAEEFREDLVQICEQVQVLKNDIAQMGYILEGNEPLKLTIHSSKAGISGDVLADCLRKNKVECEYSDRDFVVLMFSTSNNEKDFERIRKGGREAIDQVDSNVMDASKEKVKSEYMKSAMYIREAVMSPQKKVPVNEACGQVCGMSIVSCPPAIPVVVSGEIITKETIDRLIYNGIEYISIVNR